MKKLTSYHNGPFSTSREAEEYARVNFEHFKVFAKMTGIDSGYWVAVLGVDARGTYEVSVRFPPRNHPCRRRVVRCPACNTFQSYSYDDRSCICRHCQYSPG